MIKRGFGYSKKSDEKLPVSNTQSNKKFAPKLNKLVKYKGLFSFERLRLPWKHLLLLLVFWGFTIHYFERIYVKNTIKKCNWNKWESWQKDTKPYRVALYGDPQIMDAHSYPGRHPFVNALTMKILDSYHKKNWRYVQDILDPQANMFLGDLFDGGRYWDDDTWMEEFHRFNSIFPKKQNRRNIMSLPGNHDIGFGDTVIEASYNRFSTFFGDTSSSYELGNHTFYLVDTIALSDRKIPHISDKVSEYLEHVDKYQLKSNPRIMLTHVPLYRDPTVRKCGPERESKKDFPLMKGDQYQTVIDEDLSTKVLQSIKPDLIFSGDDHDYCQIKHIYRSDGKEAVAEEITTKSCAMNMGISKPGIQMLSLYNPGNSVFNEKTYETKICYLPDPYRPIFSYITLGVLTALYLIIVSMCPKFFNNKILKNIRKFSTKNLQNLSQKSVRDIKNGMESDNALLPKYDNLKGITAPKNKNGLKNIIDFSDSILEELQVETEGYSKVTCFFINVLILFFSIIVMLGFYY